MNEYEILSPDGEDIAVSAINSQNFLGYTILKARSNQ